MDWGTVAYCSIPVIIALWIWAMNMTLKAGSLSQTAKDNISSKKKQLIQYRDCTIWEEYQHFNGEFNQRLNEANRLNSKDEVSTLRKLLKQLGKRLKQYEKDSGHLATREKQCSQHSIFLHGGLYPLICFFLALIPVGIALLIGQDVPTFYIGDFNVYILGLGWYPVAKSTFVTVPFCLVISAILVVLGLSFLLQRLICIYSN
jgi:hypothetical protein